MTETYEGWTALELAMSREVGEDDPRLDILSAALFELGAAGLETKEKEGAVLLVASFPPEVGEDILDEIAAESLAVSELEGAATISTSKYAPIDWATHWKQHFHAISFGEQDQKLWIVPTWLEVPAGAKHVLRIDPSSAFGTGLHATTAMCLERIVELSPVRSILDVGTGTGVLALAALELGAERAVATDNDPEALRVAEENADRNRDAGPLILSGDDPGALREKFELVVANILARPLIELASQIAEVVAPGGRVVLSGITKAQVGDVVAAYSACGFEPENVTTREEWARLDLRSRD